jgi:hypothetical protein
MHAFMVGLAVFGAVVCVSALVTGHRLYLGADRILRSRRCEAIRFEQVPFLQIATLASATLDHPSRTEVDIHGVEAESDLKKPHDPASHRRTDADGAFDR